MSDFFHDRMAAASDELSIASRESAQFTEMLVADSLEAIERSKKAIARADLLLSKRT